MDKAKKISAVQESRWACRQRAARPGTRQDRGRVL